MKQNYASCFLSLPYFAFKSIAAMNERRAFSEGITSVVHIFFNAFDTATISGPVQPGSQLQVCRSPGNAIVAFESFSSFILYFSSKNSSAYSLVRAGILISIIFFFSLLSFVLLHTLSVYAGFFITLKVAKFLILRTFFPAKTNFSKNML